MEKIIDIHSDAKYIMDLLSICGVKSYIVGGYVRDKLLNRAWNDIDIFCEPCDLKEIFPDGNIIGGEARQGKMQTIAVNINGNVFEVSVFRGNGDRTIIGTSIEDHCLTCDFTVNALCVDKNGIVYDFVDGIKDLEDRVLRAVGNPLYRFKEDWIRIVRLHRQNCDGIWTIEERTYDLSKEAAVMIINEPVERFMAEFFKALKKPRPDLFLEFMWNTDLMGYYFPQYKHAATVYQNPIYHPEVTLKKHITQTVTACHRDARFYAFLHDYGKPSTAVDVDLITSGDYRGKTYSSFHKHEIVGSDLMPDLFEELKLSNEMLKKAQLVCELHTQAYSVAESNREATVRKFQHRAGEYLDLLEKVCRADTNGRKEFKTYVFVPLPEVVDFKPAVSGGYLIERGYQPGKKLGDIKRKCEELQIEHGINDPDEIYSMIAEAV
ncbi:CCA tRNA nucleotidyltransferase [bacterium]|nr:CCA tRNA nucleotidyltransferase [bacterium]MBI9072940.1 CCA tRNA nucleotidyltransferase [Melioribacteraceae bacterium]